MDDNHKLRMYRRIEHQLAQHKSGARTMNRSQFTRTLRELAQLRKELNIEMEDVQHRKIQEQVKNMSPWWKRSER